MFVLFFFASRRRHTRFSRDWSSDVCSSDLDITVTGRVRGDVRAPDGRVVLSRSARIDGDVVSLSPIRNPPGAVIGGTVRRASPRPSDAGGSSDSNADAVMLGGLLLALFVLAARARARRRVHKVTRTPISTARRPRARRPPAERVAMRLGALIMAGGVSIAVCITALVPGVQSLASSEKFDGKLPPLRGLSPRTTVVAADGSPLGVLGDVDREAVKLTDVPKVLIHAVIATEDRTFYSNS